MTRTNTLPARPARRTKRAASYARRSDSRGKRTDERSVQEQEELNVTCCQRNGWALPEERRYRDNDLSASRFSTKERPEWNRLVNDLQAGLIDVLVLWETSRGWRLAYEWATLVELCRENKVLIHVTTHSRTYDPTNWRDRKTLLEEGIDSEGESEKISERVRRTMAANARDGKPHAVAPYGYEIYAISPKVNGRRPVPQEASIVLEILQRVSHSEPISAIVRDLNNRGIDAPSVALKKREGKELPEKLPLWSPAMIRKICTNVAYIGRRRFISEVYGEDGEVTTVEELVTAQWPPIDNAEDFVETFWAAYNVLKEPHRKTTKPGRAKHLLAFIATCGVCGSFLSRKGGAKGPERYQCYSNASCVAIRKDWLDEYISELVCRRLAKPDIFDDLIKQDEGEARRLQARLEELWAEYNELKEFTKGKRLTAIILAREDELIAQIEETERGISNATTRIPVILKDLTEEIEGRNRIQTIKARWKRLGETRGVAPQKDVIRALFEHVTVTKAIAPGSRYADTQRVKFKFRGEAEPA